MSSTIGAQIDRLYDQEQRIDKAEAALRKLKQEREKLEAKLLRSFGMENIDGCKGRRGVASIRKAQFPSIKNRAKFVRYVAAHKAFDLFQNRIASRAYFDRLEEGEKVPGVSVYERVSVSIRRRKR